MINFNNKKLTDNTAELEQTDVFLITDRNKKYFEDSGFKNKIETITVSDLIQAWNLDQIKFIGITGTNGKTTVATAISCILNKLGYLTANQGTSGLFLNGKNLVEKNRTTPEILETLTNARKVLDLGAEFFVMEVSSHSLVQNRIEGINFAVKVHTNITADHLDFHQTIEEYRKVKNSFFSDETPKVINIDDPFVKYNSKNAVTYHFEKEITSTPLVGKFNTYNLLAAIKTVQILTNNKFSDEEILKTLKDFTGMGGRMEVVSYNPLVLVDFAHTPDGMEKVLTAFPDRKIMVVFGAGGDRDNSKRPLMGAVAEKYADEVYITSDNPRTENTEKIIEQILTGLKYPEKAMVISDRKEAIQTAVNDFLKNKEQDVLLVLGKGDETYQEINGQKIPFDDRIVLREFLKNSN